MGFDDEVTHECAVALQPQGEDSTTTIVRGIFIQLNEKIISKVTTFPLGFRWGNDDIIEAIKIKVNFFLPKEKPIEDKNGVRREILPYPWDEVAYHILKYISCEGRLSVVYAYHFRLLYEPSFQMDMPIPNGLNVL